jgi:hypothetical protein
LLVGVSRVQAETHDVATIVSILRSVLYDAETVRAFQGKVSLGFDGYDDDPREVYEIPEVRRFVSALDAEFPYWFYFLITDNEILKTITFCMCQITKPSPGRIKLEPNELQNFIVHHFEALNQLCETFGIEDDINQQISGYIESYYFPKKAS